MVSMWESVACEPGAVKKKPVRCEVGGLRVRARAGKRRVELKRSDRLGPEGDEVFVAGVWNDYDHYADQDLVASI